MPSILLDVGKLVHKYCEHDLKLVTNCSVEISVPETFATAASNSPQPEQLTYRDLWLSRGDGLQICVQLSFTESIIGYLDKPSLVEGLGLALRNAEIWPQLCLQASLTLPAADNGPASSAADIILSIAHSQDFKKGLRYASRAQPPEGVAQGGLRAVNVSFCLSEISTGKPKTKKRLTLPGIKSHGVGAVSPLLDDYGLVNGARLCMSQPTLAKVNTFDTGPEEYRSATQPVYLSDENLHDGSYGPERGTEPFSSVLSNSSETTGLASRSDWVRKTARKRRADDEPLHAGPDLHEIVELTDTALRTLISDNRNRTTAGIKCFSKKMGPKLSEIAPALFSPGYHDAVSQRSYFLPRIAHVFSCMQRRTTSTTLRKKLNRVGELPATVPIHDDQTLRPVDPIGAISCQIEVRLWSMLQRTLFDRLAARKLKPITVLSSASSFDPTLSEGLLEDLLVSSREIELKSLGGFEDDALIFSDFIEEEEDDLLFSDAVDAAEVMDDDRLLDGYQDEECAPGMVKLGSAELFHGTQDIEQQFGRINNIFTGELCEEGEYSPQDLAVSHYIDSESCNPFKGRECDRDLWRRDVNDRNEALLESELCLRPAHGLTLDEDEMMV